MRAAFVAFVIAVVFAIACVVFVVVSMHNPSENRSVHADPPAGERFP